MRVGLFNNIDVEIAKRDIKSIKTIRLKFPRKNIDRFKGYYIADKIIPVGIISHEKDGDIVCLYKTIQVNLNRGRTSRIIKLCDDGYIEWSQNIAAKTIFELMKKSQWARDMVIKYPQWEDYDNSENECCVCFDKTPDSFALPCTCICCCWECLNEQVRCPSCSEQINFKFQIK